MSRLKYENKFYEQVNTNCRVGSIMEVVELISSQYPQVPIESLKSFIVRARAFGDCRRYYTSTRKSSNQKSHPNVELTPEQIVANVSMDMVTAALRTLVIRGLEAEKKVVELTDKITEKENALNRCHSELKRMHDREAERLATEQAFKEGILKMGPNN